MTETRPSWLRCLSGVALAVALSACGSGADTTTSDPSPGASEPAARPTDPTPRPSDVAAPTGTSGPADAPTSDVGAVSAEPALAAAPEGVSSAADYPRYLWHERRLSIATTNSRDAPIEVTEIALQAPHFQRLEPESKTTTIAPGGRVDIQVDFGDLTACDVPLDGQALVHLRIAGIDPTGEVIDYLVPVDPAPLDEIRDRECAERHVRNAVDVQFSATRSVVDDVMETSIDVTRRSGTESVVVSSLRGSVIIGMDSTILTDVVAELDGDRLDLPVELTITNCDPHYVSQSTLTFVLSAFVSVDGREPVELAIEVDDTLHGELQEMITSCSAQLPPT